MNPDFLEHRSKVEALAWQLRQHGRFEEAIELYSKLLQMHRVDAKQRVIWLNERGICHAAAGKLQLAIRDYTEGLQIAGDDIDLFNNRGNARVLLREWSLAERDFTSALSLSESFPQALNGRGVAWHKMGDYEKAECDFKACLHVAPEYLSAYFNYAVLRRDLEDFAGAIALLERADHSDSDVWQLRAECHENLGESAAAIECQRKATKLEDRKK